MLQEAQPLFCSARGPVLSMSVCWRLAEGSSGPSRPLPLSLVMGGMAVSSGPCPVRPRHSIYQGAALVFPVWTARSDVLAHVNTFRDLQYSVFMFFLSRTFPQEQRGTRSPARSRDPRWRLPGRGETPVASTG